MNIVHSCDAYVLRSLVRRCSYDLDVARMAYDEIEVELLRRACGEQMGDWDYTDKVAYYMEQHQRSGIVDPVILDWLTAADFMVLPYGYLRRLQALMKTMLEHPPFDIITIHDDFKCHARHMNQLRKHYRNILADIADSDLVSDLLSQLYGQPGNFIKKSNNLGAKIRANSNYHLC